MQPLLTAELWASIASIFHAILDHPFIQGLTDGSLPDRNFRFYVIQDALFLQDYARSLAVAAARAPRDSWCTMFAEHARDALMAERTLHESFFEEWGLSLEEVYATARTPTTLAYTSYLWRVAYAASFAELVGALLPCYWIYWEVGKVLEAKGSPHSTYQKWIDLYASEQFAASVRPVLDVMNALAIELSENQQAVIRQHFMVTSRYEWMFWDAAWRLEEWPVG